MKKAYESHEIAYARMVEKGIASWYQYGGDDDDPNRQIETETEDFFTLALKQPLFPKTGKILELGCGTGVMLRWFAAKGYTGVGIDISKTAIEMAIEQSQGSNLQFYQDDVCHLDADKYGKFDVVLDGHCLHCITNLHDRKSLLDGAHKLLSKDGVLIIATMVGPVNLKAFKEQQKTSVYRDNLIYVPFTQANEYENSIAIKNKLYIPTRYVGHWNSVMQEIKHAGFNIPVVYLRNNNTREANGTLNLIAILEKS